MTVDDSASVRQTINRTLQDAGHVAVEARDGKDAQAKRSGTVDMIVTDLNMPGMDSIELTRAVRTSGTHKFVPILLLTTASRTSRKEEGKTAGATGWLTKPFKPEQLLAVARKLRR